MFEQSKELQQESIRINRKFIQAKTARAKWFKRGREYEQLVHNDVDYTGTQFTSAELAELQKKESIPLSVNILIAIIEQIIAFLTSNPPSIGILPVGKSSKSFTYVWREVLKAVMYLNKFPMHQERAIKDMLIVGHGILLVEPNNFFQHNEFNTVIKYIPWDYFYCDPASISPDYQDAEILFLATPMPSSKALKMYGSYGLTAEHLNMVSAVLTGDDNQFLSSLSNYSNTFSSGNKDDKPVWLLEAFEKVQSTIYILQDGSKTTVKPQPEIDANGKLQDLTIGQYNDVLVKRTLKLGQLILWQEILPITKYPIFDYVHLHNRNPFPYGVVHNIVDLEYAANKLIALIIENIQKSPGGGVMAAAGSISDRNKFVKERSRINGIAEFEASPDLPNGGAPIQMQPQPLNSAAYTMFKDLIGLMEKITGVFDLVQGDGANAPQTLGATTSIQNFGTQRPKMYARRLDWTNQDVMETVIEFMQAYSPMGNMLNYIEGTSAWMSIEMDVKSKMQETDKGQQPVPNEYGDQTATYIHDEVTRQTTAILGSVKVGQYRVRYQSSNNLPTTREMAKQVLQSALQVASDGSTQMVIMQSLLDLIDFPETDKVLNDINLANKLQDTISQLQEKVANDQKELKRLEKDNEILMYKAKDAELQALVTVAKKDVAIAAKEIKAGADEIINNNKKEVYS